jgi:hypothetical protein
MTTHTAHFWHTRLVPLLLAAVLLTGLLNTARAADQDPWPRRFDHPKGKVIMYQPQLEDLEGDKLTARAAVAAKKKDWQEPLFGAVWLSARVVTDRDTRMTTIDEVKVTDARFPNATPEQLAKLKTFLNEEIEDWAFTMSMDRLLAALEVVEKEQRQDQNLNNQPPKIIFRDHPAVLVLLDGDPKLLPIPDSKLMQVANTPFFMLYDPAGRSYYLKGGEHWLSAADVQGPWQDLPALPATLQAFQNRLEEQKAAAAKKAGQKPAGKKEVAKQAGVLPEIVVSTVPAELLTTDGAPEYTPVKDANLLFVSNTENTIFMDTASQEYYTLISGRWFKGKTLKDGPWSYVAPDQLPADFAKIPPDSAKGFVLVNVAGTTQAKEAVLDNSIPQTAVIDRKKAKTEVKYAGDPKFEKIAGTDLEYAVNTGKAVFKEGTKYYVVDQGV